MTFDLGSTSPDLLSQEFDWGTDASLGDAAAVAGVFSPVQVKPASEQVLERLVTALTLGWYLPGQRLPSERELAARLDVSRVTVRDALGRLESLGLVETRRGRYGGTFVHTSWAPDSTDLVRRVLVPSWHRLLALFDLGQQVLPMIAALAAERRGDDDITRLDDAVALIVAPFHAWC